MPKTEGIRTRETNEITAFESDLVAGDMPIRTLMQLPVETREYGGSYLQHVVAPPSLQLLHVARKV